MSNRYALFTVATVCLNFAVLAAHSAEAVQSAAIVIPRIAGLRASANPDLRFESLVNGALRSGVPGVQVYVKVRDLVWSRAGGYFSIENSVPMLVSHRMRVASITKMMTYAVTMEFVKHGRIRLDQRAAALLSDGELNGVPFSGEMTVGQLLEHESGLHSFNGAQGGDFFHDLYSDPKFGQRQWNARQLIAYARRPENVPTGRPGSGTWYSSTGYVVLQLILEKLSGKPIRDLYGAYIFDPLGMTSAGMEGVALSAHDIADSYAIRSKDDENGASPFGRRIPVRSDGLVNVSRGLKYYNAWSQAAGAVAVNATDLAKFMSAVCSNRFQVLKDQSTELAKVAQTPKDYAWNGGSWGIQATILFVPNPGLTVIVLEDSSNVGIGSHELASQLLSAARSQLAATGAAQTGRLAK